MKKFFLRLPAQVLQSACLFVVAYTVLRIFGRISVIEFSLRPVLGLLAYCLLAAAFLGAMGREAGVIGTLGMLAVVSVFWWKYAVDLGQQAVYIVIWAGGGYPKDSPLRFEVTALVLFAALFLFLLFRLLSGFRATVFVLLAVFIAYVIAMPQAKISVTAADALPGIAAIIVLFFASQMEKTEDQHYGARLKAAGKRRTDRTGGKASVARRGFRNGQGRETVRSTETVPFRRQAVRVLLGCGLISIALAIAIPAAGRLTKSQSSKVRTAAADIEHRIRSEYASASGQAFDVPELDGRVGRQLNRYTGAEQFTARLDSAPVEDLYIKAFTGGAYSDGNWAAETDWKTANDMAAALRLQQKSDAWLWQLDWNFNMGLYSEQDFRREMTEGTRILSGEELLGILPRVYAGLNQVAATRFPEFFHAPNADEDVSLDYFDEDMAYYEVPVSSYGEGYGEDYLSMPFDPATMSEADDVAVSQLYFYGGQVYERTLLGKLNFVSGGDGPIPELADGYYAAAAGTDVTKYLPVTNLRLRRPAGSQISWPALSVYLPTYKSDGASTDMDSRLFFTGAFLSRKDTVGLDWSGMDGYGDAIAKGLAMKDYYEKNGLSRYLSVPDGLSRLREYVAQHPLTDEAEITAFIRYTLDTHASYSLLAGDPHDGTDPVEYFLFDSHRGYCEQYASAATLMYRLYGIPARYVTGYRVKQEEFSAQETDGSWTAQVPDRDAHAWVELYFPTVGWTPVEMTVTGEQNPETLVYPGLTEGELTQIRQEKGWTKETVSADRPEADDTNDTNVTPQAAPSAATGSAAAQTTSENAGGHAVELNAKTVCLLRTILIIAVCAVLLLVLLLLLRHYYRTLRPAKVGRAFERRFGKCGRAFGHHDRKAVRAFKSRHRKSFEEFGHRSGATGLRIESRDFAAKAAAAFPDIPEADFAAFRAAVLSDAYNAPADEATAEQVREFYRRVRRG